MITDNNFAKSSKSRLKDIATSKHSFDLSLSLFRIELWCTLSIHLAEPDSALRLWFGIRKSAFQNMLRLALN